MNEFFEETWKVLSIIVTILTFILTNAFKIIAYSYHKGRYEYLKIPNEYISVDYEQTLFSFLGVMAISIFVILLIYVHSKGLDAIKEKSRGIKKVIKLIGATIVAPIIIMVILSMYLISQLTIQMILDNKMILLKELIILTGILSAVYYVLMYIIKGKSSYKKDTLNTVNSDACENADNEKKEVKEQNEDGKIEEKKEQSKNKSNVGIYIIAILVLFLLGYILYCFKNIGMESMNFIDQIRIVEIDGKQYAVMEKYEENWIVKQCLYDNENIVINANHYMIVDISEKDIWVVYLNGGKTIKDCMRNDDEFVK